MIEFMPWYQTGAQMLRCQECGTLLVDGDTEVHVRWHEKVGAS